MGAAEPTDERVPPVRDDEGGDPVCWLDRVCEECGGFITDAGACACEASRS